MNKTATLVSRTLVASMLIGTAFPQAPQTTTPSTGQESAPAQVPGARGGGRPTPPPPPPAVMPPPVTPIVTMTPPNPDPRVGLAPGRWDAAQAAWNMRMVSTTPPSGSSAGATHSDLAFTGKYVIQGNYNGFEIWDISNPAKPVLANAYECPASQNDVSVYKNLLFMSSEGTNSRQDCKFGGVPAPASEDRVRGVRIFDISDMAHPKLVASLQTCRGSHTHTVVTQPGDPNNVYIYVSGTANVRPGAELKGCQDGGRDDPNSARFRLEVIKVPLAKPSAAAIVSSPRIFNNLPVAPRNEERAKIDEAARKAAEAARAEAAARGDADAIAAQRANEERRNAPPAPPTGPNQCHDITVYPEIGLAGGACAGLGLLLDIRDAAHPFRIDMAGDGNMSFWHSATFNNDGTKVLFSDEWGGGTQPRCRATDKPEWGADALFTIENKNLVFHSYYKIPAPQTDKENCVAHNGSLIPIPGRDVMVQAFYQGGITVFDWTDAAHPKEIAFFDRGPLDANKLLLAGSWSAYWYNGVIVSSEIARGGYLRAAPERAHNAKRTRSGQDRELRLLQHAGPAKVRLASEFSARQCIPRSARALQRPFDGADQVNTRRSRWRRTLVETAAPYFAHATRDAVEQRGGAVFGFWKDEAAGQCGDGSRKSTLNGFQSNRLRHGSSA